MTSLLGSDKPLFTAHDAALVDLDGVAYRGAHAIPSAPAALQAARDAGMGIVFVTNNASREPSAVAAHLTELGMTTAEHEVLTAAQAVSLMVRDALPAGSPLYVVGGQGLRTALTDVGMVLVESAQDNPVAVVQGFNPDVSWKELAEASYAIRQGAQFFASNMDLTIPNDRGVAPGNGSLVNVVITATGVTPPSAGKPAPAMFTLAAQQAGASSPMVIGDRLDTDLKGARAAGFPGLLVLTGVNDGRDAVLAPPDQRPAYIGATMECLAHPHPHPRNIDGVWWVNEAQASVQDGDLTVDGGTELDRVRAACVAAWASADAGQPVRVETLPNLGVSFQA
ncbi:HAD-IIA family hydrolase [Demequina sp. B12]|uniref:HAD-IIA family hydrolase n=1 Tax=Demequina sp. B12 TaxID=2992757 RepID=UPI00237B03BD|nr:HAD-IIA family hydrolase [Demequina sp. B12]MDE0573251.1 HAD-IIA family hydrolase [Demequina sp. B12]